MKELEKIVRDTFQDFEPEVNPALWDKLQQNLSAPADPTSASSVSSGGNAVVKTLTGKMAGWIAGVFTTAAITTAIVVSVQKDAAVEKSVLSQENTTVVQQVETTSAESSIEPVADKVEQPLQNNRSEQVVIAKEKSGQNQPENRSAEKSAVKNDQAPASAPSAISPDPVKPDVFRNTVPVTNNGNLAAETENIPEKVSPSPVAQAGAKSENEVAVEPVIITSSECGFAPLKIVALLNTENSKGRWDFGDGQGASAAGTVTHVYERPGTYLMQYSDGIREITKTIEVIGTVSTAFTPNGDGVNDEFFINASLEEIIMKIFDRGGNLVAEVNNPSARWNGKNFNGDDLPSGTYFYDIFARSAHGKTISQKGTINIFR